MTDNKSEKRRRAYKKGRDPYDRKQYEPLTRRGDIDPLESDRPCKFFPESGKVSIIYVTGRKEPKLEWFIYSLNREADSCKENISIQVIVVDHYKHDAGRFASLLNKTPFLFLHVAPKPCPWSGPFRLTKQDYFSVSNSRNTGLCYARGEYVVFVDDVSFLCEGWLTRAVQGRNKNEIVGGAFQKMKQMEVDNFGNLKKAVAFEAGKDARERILDQKRKVRMNGGALYGCSIAAPMSAYFATNGFDEDCDSMGGEDYSFGLMAERNGYPVMYDPHMRTLESEEHHHNPADVKKRIIKKTPDPKHIDFSHVYLNMILHGGRHRAPNYFPAGDLAKQRDAILGGARFPESVAPYHDWRDSQPLETM